MKDKAEMEKYMQPIQENTKKTAKNVDIERLHKPADKHYSKAFLKIYENAEQRNSPLKARKTDPKEKNKIAKEVTERLSTYQDVKTNEMKVLHQRREKELANEHQQFKPCKGSEKIAKSLFKKEREYSSPVHDRLFNKIKAKKEEIEAVVSSATLKNSRTAASQSNIKYTTDLSNSISINKRLGVEHLLPQKDYNRAAAQRKLEEDKKARAEFEEMVKERKRDTAMNKSKLSTTSKMSKSTVPLSSSKTIAKASAKGNKANVNTVSKPLPTSNKYLYKRLCTEIDEHVKDLQNEDYNAQMLSKDHIRVILVKTGFIGNDIQNMNEIKHDESQLEQIWNTLKGDDKGFITPKELKTICGVIQGVHAPTTKDARFEDKSIKTKFARSTANRNKFVRDKIKEKQIEKTKPTETYQPEINKNSIMIESRKSGGHQIPRYEILLEMGRMYNLDREQKQLAMLQSEDAIYSNDGDLSEDIRQFAEEKAYEQQKFRDAIKELKNNNFSPQDIEYVEDYQIQKLENLSINHEAPDNEEYDEKERSNNE